MKGGIDMAKLMNEKQVLKKLDIPDFRHITKDHVITLTSMLDKVDPEVAKKALEQFPEFASLAKEMVVEQKRIIDKAFEENAKGVEAYYAACKQILDALEKQLDKDDLTSEERSEIIDNMLAVAENMSRKDAENKKFHLDAIKYFGGFAAVVGVVAVAVLGGNTKIDFDQLADKLPGR